MNLFDKLVDQALKNQPKLSQLRNVVEKELLHHDILGIMRDNGLLEGLTFIGGTCLRACYGGIRLSEDLDFTGGGDFSRDKLSIMGGILKQSLQKKYGLRVTVTEPVKDTQNVDTWKIKIETREESKNLPAQRINIDICAVPSYEKRPMLLINHYGVEMGTSGLLIQAQSLEEIYTDKLLALALRPNRVKYRDLWDIFWLQGKGIEPITELIPKKLSDRNQSINNFLNLFKQRVQMLKDEPKMQIEFKQELLRFLPLEQVNKTLEQENLWEFIINLLGFLNNKVSVHV